MKFKKLTAVLLAGLMMVEMIPFQLNYAEAQAESTVANAAENPVENQTEIVDDVEIPPSQTTIETTVASKIYATESPKEDITSSSYNNKISKDSKQPTLKASPLSQDKSLMRASSETDYSNFNMLTAPSVMNNLINKKYAMADSEKISPLTGDLTYSQTDLVLPGRNGLNLVIGRTYQSNQALLGDRWLNRKGLMYQDTSTYLNNRYFLGAGWTFNFPSVEVRKTDDKSELYYHNGFGQVEHVLFSFSQTDNSNLENHYEKDVKFDKDTSFTNGQMQSAYVYIAADKTKQYFAADGRFLGTVDRFNNRILFTHTMESVSNLVPNYDFVYANGTEGNGWTKIAANGIGCDQDTTEGKGDTTSLKYWSNYGNTSDNYSYT